MGEEQVLETIEGVGEVKTESTKEVVVETPPQPVVETPQKVVKKSGRKRGRPKKNPTIKDVAINNGLK